ncbi:SET domain-containing protein [Ophiobolus disseminans]|uniref:SET domain-containing protein n=1 Tax=Ophiobolus disseminans TaxID=1469910 RepID=A0A6A7A3F0_9PLEO|nr:SET domain-containing protein [Ophiobolus disseminans]
MVKTLTQEQIFKKATMRPSKRKRQPVVLAEKDVTEILLQLYDKKLSGPHHFYFQNEHGMPIGKIPTEVGPDSIYCTVANSNVFSGHDWVHTRKPNGFKGKVWPPTRLAHLIGSPKVTERCICGETKACDCTQKLFSDHLLEYWINQILIRPVPGRGFGAFARKRIEVHNIVGEYTGQVSPQNPSLSDEETQYHTEVSIGEAVTSKVTTWIDATRTGSVTRFFNHSCKPNCKFWEGRCGTGSRVVYVEALRNIKPAEELTLDYGDEWFTDPAHPCLCGQRNCKNPPGRDLIEVDEHGSPDNTEEDDDTESEDEQPRKKKTRR